MLTHEQIQMKIAVNGNMGLVKRNRKWETVRSGTQVSKEWLKCLKTFIFKVNISFFKSPFQLCTQMSHFHAYLISCKHSLSNDTTKLFSFIPFPWRQSACFLASMVTLDYLLQHHPSSSHHVDEKPKLVFLVDSDRAEQAHVFPPSVASKKLWMSYFSF